MPKRTNPPLTNAECQRRYRLRHPEKKEEYRLLKRRLYAEKRQKQLAERLAVTLPNEDEFGLDPEARAALASLTKYRKIETGLAQQDQSDEPDSPTQGSKV